MNPQLRRHGATGRVSERERERELGALNIMHISEAPWVSSPCSSDPRSELGRGDSISAAWHVWGIINGTVSGSRVTYTTPAPKALTRGCSTITAASKPSLEIFAFQITLDDHSKNGLEVEFKRNPSCLFLTKTGERHMLCFSKPAWALCRVAVAWGGKCSLRLIFTGCSQSAASLPALARPRGSVGRQTSSTAPDASVQLVKRMKDFAYVARDKDTRILKCHVFRCDTPAKAIATSLHHICSKEEVEGFREMAARPRRGGEWQRSVSMKALPLPQHRGDLHTAPTAMGARED
ncbi:hypothetical protein JZ751_022381 [Albula glossodonta]|uniref:PID domain-containing protein n=1 Tax=Albula glossodonta TaxID=121402 RepID=A0A8T2NGZ2_9TELE|nr:hypothetical protein JZ751_022381 [Albula glossodonta]